MGLFDSLFGSRESTPKVSVIADPYKDVRESLNKWLTSNMGNTNQYSGERVAGMTDQEKQSMSFLDQYAGGGQARSFKLGADEINKTLAGDYDPASSPYYQAVKAEAARNLKDTQDNIADKAAGGGRYWTGGRLAEQGEAATNTGIDLNKTLGAIAENERQNRLNVLPLAMQWAQYEEEDPLRKSQALQTLGSLPRAIQQAILDADYEEWNTANRQYPLQVASLASGVQQAPMYGETKELPSTFMSMLGEVSPVVGSYNKHKYGYSTGQTSINDAINTILKTMKTS